MPFDNSPQHPHAAEITIVGRMQQLLATEDRWCQGTTFLPKTDGPPAHCLMGALNVADNKPHSGLDWLSPSAGYVSRYLRGELPSHPSNWNDDPRRTHAEVLDLLVRVRRHFEEASDG